jgi:hypothetical protein
MSGIFRIGVSTAVCSLLVGLASAQVQKFEFGGQVTQLNTNIGFDAPREGFAGFGGRFTYNLTPRIGFEAETSYLPNSSEGKIVSLFGAKVGLRKPAFGLFAKARPGLINLRYRQECGIPESCPGPISPATLPKSYFAFDVGGVLEVYDLGFYKSDKLFFRLDAGDTFASFGWDYWSAVDGQSIRTHVDRPRHNPQVSVGAGFRF